MAADARAVSLQQHAQDGQVMFEIVDRTRGIVRRRPGESGPPFRRGAVLQFLVIRHPSGDRAHDVQGVEGRHAWTRFRDLDARVRQPEPLGRGPDREPQQQPLRLTAVFLVGEVGAERHAHLAIEHHRVFVRLARKHPLGEAGNEDHTERPPARLLRAGHEHAAVPRCRRIVLEQEEAIGDHIARFVERHRADIRHRTQFRDDPDDPFRLPQDPRRQCLEQVQPLAPRRRRRP